MANILETINRVRQERENKKRRVDQEYEERTRQTIQKEQEEARREEEQKNTLVKKFEGLVEKTGIKTEMELIGRDLIPKDEPGALWSISFDEPETRGLDTIARIKLGWGLNSWSGYRDKTITCEFDLKKEELIIFGAVVKEPSLSIKDCLANKEKMREQLAKAYLEPSIAPEPSAGADKPDYGGFVD